MSRREIRGSERIAKSKNKRVEHKKILIAAEGVNTEPQYFERLAAFLKARAVRVVSVKSVGVGKDPLTVVQEAGRRRDAEKKEGDSFDEVWCVVDVDTHASLERACIEARRRGIEIAISCPSFEIWLLWHFQNHAAWTNTDALSKILQNKWGFSGKSMPDNFPYGDYEAAIKRAARCESPKVAHLPPNPHSSLPVLVRSIVEAHSGKQV